MTAAVVTKNKIVAITYSLYDEKGEMVEHTDIPVIYLHGADSDLFIPIEQALDGCKVGDTVEVILTPQEGFGAHDPSLTFSDDLENVPEELRVVGTELEAQNAKGETLKFVVKDIDTENGVLTVDANHPLAGQTVRFEVTVKEIRDPTPQELQQGGPASAFNPTLQ